MSQTCDWFVILITFLEMGAECRTEEFLSVVTTYIEHAKPNLLIITIQIETPQLFATLYFLKMSIFPAARRVNDGPSLYL